MRVKSLQLCPTLCDPMDCSPPGSSVQRILQAGILKWVVLSFSRGSSQPRDRTHVSMSPALACFFITVGIAQMFNLGLLFFSLDMLSQVVLFRVFLYCSDLQTYTPSCLLAATHGCSTGILKLSEFKSKLIFFSLKNTLLPVCFIPKPPKL